MNFIIRTRIANTTKESVIKAFDRSMFLRLAPPFPKLELLRFDGCETGDEIHLQLGFILYKKKWVSQVTANGSKNNELYFVDEGSTLPPPLHYWKHYHGIHQEGTNVVVEDNVMYQSGNIILDILLYPFFYLLFFYRKPIYKKYLNGLK
jgi:ligand-binding SRPBCC domain-containing protein